MQTPGNMANQGSPWDQGNRSKAQLRFGDRMAVQSDKELNDLLDFSAMFSPPVPGQPMKNGPNPPPESTMYPGYKGGMEEGGNWGPGGQQGPGYESRMYDGQNYNGQHSGENMPFMNNSDMPTLMNKSSDYRSSYSSREGPVQQGIMGGNNMPLSPDAIASAKPTVPPYYNSKRPMDEYNRGRPTGKFTPPDHGKRRKTGVVYSPSPDDFHQDSPRYQGTGNSPKPMSYSDYFMEPQSHSSGDPWSSSNAMPSSSYQASITSGSHYSQNSPYTSMHHPHETGYHPVSPSQESLMSSGLPPMSTFRGGPAMPNTSTAYSTTSSSVNGSEMMSNRPQGGSQTGDALGKALASVPQHRRAPPPPPQSSQTAATLGKALASIYSTEHTNSSYGGSNPSTPVSSPPPMSAGPNPNWHRPNNTSTTSPHFESHLHSLTGQMEERLSQAIQILGEHGPNQQSKMEERLDDAIHVLRNHAEHQPGMPSHLGMPGMMPPGQSNGIMGNMGGYPGMGMMQGHMDAHMQGNHPSMSENRSQSGGMSASSTDQTKTYENLRSDQSQEPNTDGSIKVELADKNSEGDNKGDQPPKSSAKGSTNSTPPTGNPPSTKRSRSKVDDDDNLSEGDDNESPEGKQERERLRRQANNARERYVASKTTPLVKAALNNARERVRVRDINEAFKELGQMVTLHCSSSQPLTKLMILQQAVNVITSLEQQVRERNLNPKAACLKRREEEKSDDMPGRMNADDIAQQAALAGSAALMGRMGATASSNRLSPGGMLPTTTHGAYTNVYLQAGHPSDGQENRLDLGMPPVSVTTADAAVAKLGQQANRSVLSLSDSVAHAAGVTGSSAGHVGASGGQMVPPLTDSNADTLGGRFSVDQGPP
ncbi:transcription factor 4-like isoform X3 [Haliotis rufescens]|uniref:transcription factor 4-like isoform X3 n=1 Tax=Haliotis rufescens TaxID=6454 RepID=UPI001EAF9191|nr:transcription factor 4-like isoform X3 [Haliotis rufescens]